MPSESHAMAPPPSSADTVLDEAFFDTVKNLMDADVELQGA